MFDSNNRIHINFSTDKASDGTIIRSSIMVNIYEQDVENAVKLYRDLKEQLGGFHTSTNTTEVIRFPECPDHKVKMLMRTRRSDGGIFFGCPMFVNGGCKKTVQYPVSPKTSVAE